MSPILAVRPLVELVEDGRISYGIVQPGSDTPGGIPIVRVKDVRDGLIDPKNPLRVEPSIAQSYWRTTLKGGELLLSLVGTVGEAAVVPPTLAGWNVARAIAVIRPTGIEARWLHLCFELPSIRQRVTSVLNTTVQSTLNLSDLRLLPIPVPSPAVRTAVLDVIGSLDGKITGNTAIATTAGNVSAALFQLAVAGIQLSKFAFEDVAEIGGGGTPSTSIPEYWSGSVSWATPTDVTALRGPYLHSTARMITKSGLEACSSPLYPAGSILMTSRATIGAFAIAECSMAVNQGFIVVNPRDPRLQWWIFHEMASRVDEFVNQANGATFLELSRGRFRRFAVRLSEEATMHRFNADATTLHDAARAALVENAQLAVLRDTMLPQLLSGKLRVKDTEKQVEEVL